MTPAAVLSILIKTSGAAAATGQLNAVNAAGARAGGSFESLSKQATNAGRSMRSAGSGLTHGVTVPLVALGVAAGKASSEFQKAMEMIHTQAGASQKEVNGLKGQVLELAKRAKQGPTELANALYRLEGAGLRGQKAMKALKAASDLAAVGNADVEDTAKTLSQTWFSGIKGAKDFRKVVGELNATVGAGDLRLQNLVDALGTGILPVARQAGLKLRDITGVLATFGDETKNVDGWAAQFSTALHYLYAPTSKAEKALSSIGLSGRKLGQDMRGSGGLLSALKDLRDHLGALSGGARGLDAAEVLSKILPGGRGRVISVLLNQLDRYQQKLDQIAGTTNRFGDSVAKTQQTAAFKISSAWSNVQVAFVKLGDSLLPVVVPIFQKVAGAVSSLADRFSGLSPHTRKLIVEAALVAAALGPVAAILGTVTIALGLLLSPIGAAVAAFAALGAGFVAAYAKSARFRGAIQSIGPVVGAVIGWLKQAAGWLSGAFTAALKGATGWVDQNRTHINLFAQALKNVITVAAAPFVAFFKAAFIPAMKAAWNLVKAVWPDIKTIVGGALTTLGGMVKIFSGVFTGNWREAWNGVKDVFRGAVTQLKGILRGLLDGAVALIKGFAGTFKSVGSMIVNAIFDGMKAAVDKVGGVVGGIKDKIVGAFKGVFGINSPSKVMEGIGNSLAAGLVKGTSSMNPFGGLPGGGPSGPPPAGSARDWLTKALQDTHHFSAANLAALYGRMMQESGGNPRAINLSDSNAAAGHPSKGLLQTIDSTFASYALPGHGNIWNPIDNAIAAIRYMFARYGHIVGPSNSGYAGGTSGAAKGVALVGERGPELVNFKGGETVLTHGQTMRLLAAGMPGYAKGTKKGHPGPGTRPKKGVRFPSTNPFGVPQRGPAKGVPYVPPSDRVVVDTGPTPAEQALIDAQNAAAEAAQALADAEKAMADQLAGVKDELKRQTDFATSVQATSNFQLTKSLADLLSGHIVGRGLAGRAFTPGTGVEVAY